MQTRTLPVQSRAAELSARIEERTALVGIIGLGYVGLPLALTFTEQRFRVLGFDIDSAKVDALARGEIYIKHLDPARVERAIQSGGLRSTADFARLSEPDVLIICVPTPLTIQRDPDMQLDGRRPVALEGEGRLSCRFKGIPLLPQAYTIQMAIRSKNGRDWMLPYQEVAAFNVSAPLEDYGFRSEVIHRFVGGAVPVLIPYEWTHPDGSVDSVGIKRGSSVEPRLDRIDDLVGRE